MEHAASPGVETTRNFSDVAFVVEMQNGRVCLEESLTYPTWKKYKVLHTCISNLRVRDKRTIFNIMRNDENVSHDTFFPMFGFTGGEFAVMHMLSDGGRRKVRNKRASTRAKPHSST